MTVEIPRSSLKDLYQIWHLNPASMIFPETFERFIPIGHYIILDDDGKPMTPEDALSLLPTNPKTANITA